MLIREICRMIKEEILKAFGLEKTPYACATGLDWFGEKGEIRKITSPIDDAQIGEIRLTSKEDYEKVVETSLAAFQIWREIPAPKRGDIVRQYGEELRNYKIPLGHLVSLEMGKILQEGMGEVQEMIDICDFAVGLSRQLYGLTMHSERPHHRMYEQWHPLGIVGIISAFNFPVAVWAWNAMIAAVCGDVCIWKPSEKTPLTAMACQKLWANVLKKNQLPEGILNLVIGHRELGTWMSHDERIPLISATGSTNMGKSVGAAVGARLGRSLLELGGNNAIILTPHADIELALRAVLFGAVGTAGQRCTTTRRLIIHDSLFDDFVSRLVSAYQNIKIGNPLLPETLVGPLIDRDAVNNFKSAVQKALDMGGKLLAGNIESNLLGECYVTPCIIEAENHWDIVQKETFAPILYVMKYSNIEDAIEMQNSVKQGLSSSIFSLNLKETEKFLSVAGSDCGIANVNIGTSGAEIGGAFGGEKETGGGRESGSDSWKAYMRRQTNTINYSNQLPLAQGITFKI